MDAVHQIASVEGVGLAGAGAAAAHIDGGDGAAPGKHNRGTGLPPAAHTLVVADSQAHDVGQRAATEWIVGRPGGHAGTVVLRSRCLPTVASVPAVLDDCHPLRSPARRAAAGTKRMVGDLIHSARETAGAWAAIGPDTRRGRRFGAFGGGSIICFPPATIMNECYIRIGRGTVIGADVSLSAGMVPGQRCVTDPVVRIGDRCLIGRGSGIVGHLGIDIGDDVWTGQFVYITDQNHGYDDPRVPISKQAQPERPVTIGDGSWLGHGTVVLPGARIGRHVVIGANSVVTGEIPDYSIAVGAPARVVKSQRPVSDTDKSVSET